LGFFVLAGAPLALERGRDAWTPFFAGEWRDGSSLHGLLGACALMFVAYTGYGRIATLGEEVHDPARTIPRAILIVMAVTAVLYVSVAAVAVGTVGFEQLSAATRRTGAPLAAAAAVFAPGVGPWILAVGAVTALLGVLLNLIVGLSRVALAMGRRGDLPPVLSRIDASGTTPGPAVVAVGLLVAGIACTGSVRTTWSFSAFTVLIYYAITNLAALRLDAASRRYPRWISGAGLCACAFLAFWVDRRTWTTGLGLIAAGLVWHLAARAIRRSRA
jgi:APA family basic amino acid/polyamine antiporter